MNWAVKSDLVPDNPFEGMAGDLKKTARDTSKEPFSQEERDAIVAAFENNTFSSKFAPIPHSYYAPYVKFLFMTGCHSEEAIARGVGEEINALVAPTINVGMALHHTAFPGTISLKPSTMIQVIKDYVTCLAKAGFTKFFFINGHGGNIATLKAAFAETYAHLADLNLPNAEIVQCQVGNWFMCGSVYKLAQELYGNQEGSHATPSEVAVTQFVYPEAIEQAPLSPQVRSGYKIYGATDFRQRYADGRMGSNPALATPEHGKQFYELAVKELSNSYLEFLNQE